MFKLAALNRWQAGGGHLMISAFVGAAVFLAMILVWYPPPYFAASGGNDLVLLILGVDITLGPLLTTAVFDPSKGLRKLRFDLIVIGCLQLTALAYGVSVMFTARPAYLVYAVDRFDLVMANLLPDSELAKAAPPYDRRPIGKPPTVGAQIPDDPKLKQESLFIALGGIDLPQQPRFYVRYEDVARDAAAKAQSLDELRKLNPNDAERIDTLVRNAGRRADELGFLAARAPNRDFAVIVDKASGEIIDKLSLRPW